ncbi:MAG TPA: DUF4097 family beta strand repeat-containing protein, partial [Solirubrobacteraceae bacterium]|nr:DUF4097 family beta strand repeat-containing protein [Solirubrobacteraceae bacterium]
ADGRLLVKAPKGWRQYTFRGGGESVAVQIDLPTGSRVHGNGGMAGLRSTGRLGECRFKTGLGEIRLDEAGPVELKTGMGDIAVGRAVDHADLSTGSGALTVDRIDGTGVIKNSNGDSLIGEVTGDLRVNAANGRISVDRADAAVTARTANGDIRLGEVAHGAVVAETGFGKLDLAIRDGVPAWLDLTTGCGSVHSDLDDAERPQPGEDAVEVRGRSGFGEIRIRRAPHHVRATSAGATP